MHTHTHTLIEKEEREGGRERDLAESFSARSHAFSSLSLFSLSTLSLSFSLQSEV